ncbi:MAG: carboxylesterase family protein [Lachnospiraceae bacterium]|nr:carboxylesterase family protein [Lachnospiraceae bacterium]
MQRKAITENGTVLGMQGGNARITVYKGVPFAKPPVGELRWREPQPAENWEGERPCYLFAPISMQEIPGWNKENIYTREWHVNSDIPMSEDCLYLNIWTPAVSPDEKLPVLVWIFGGGYQVGYPAEMEFDGEALAKRGIVVVSVNYRVGAFGFLAHPELTAAQPDFPTNFGLLDQQAGIRWVKRNIAGFGGDPDQITIAGQSAGGGSVMYQITNPDNEGLITRATAISGVVRDPYRTAFPGNGRTIKDMEKLGEEFFEFMGVKTLAEARAIDAVTLRDGYEKYRNGAMRLGPCVDGVFNKADTYRIFADGKALDIPFMAGNTMDEFKASIMAENDEAFEKKVREIFGEDADEFLSFPEAKLRAPNGAYAPISMIECGLKHMLEEGEENGRSGKSFYYRFNEDIPGWDQPGNFHSSDLWFFFDNLQKCWRPFTGRHYDLARQMADYWTNFIKTGDPNGQGSDGLMLPEWKPYRKDAEEGMVFDVRGSMPEHGDPAVKRFLTARIS